MHGHEISLDEIEQHFWLTRSVARVMGVSLSEAMADGRLSLDQLTEMVSRCRAAGCHKACLQWLADQSATADAAPAHCASAQLLKQLRQPRQA